VMGWVTNKTNPANLVMFYIEEPDTHAHAFGPDSQKITDFVERLDKATEYLYKRIHELNLENRVSVIHLSDHGMDNMQLKNVIDLRTIISHKVAYYGSTPVLQIVPENDAEVEEIYEKLQNESKSRKTFKAYRNSDLPQRWRFNNKYRVGPITVVAELKYGFQDMYEEAKWYEKAYNVTISPENKYGVHGYDNDIESMHPIFFAYGNLIKKFNQVEPFDTVDLMYLFCEIIGLNPPSYLKGNRENILSILSQSVSSKLSRWIVLSEYITNAPLGLFKTLNVLK
jgi:ectonucleotide pyrophosphatase/phosphodiesterase family member 5